MNKINARIIQIQFSLLLYLTSYCYMGRPLSKSQIVRRFLCSFVVDASSQNYDVTAIQSLFPIPFSYFSYDRFYFEFDQILRLVGSSAYWQRVVNWIVVLLTSIRFDSRCVRERIRIRLVSVSPSYSLQSMSVSMSVYIFISFISYLTFRIHVCHTYHYN